MANEELKIETGSKKKSKLLLIIIAVVVILGVGAGAYFFFFMGATPSMTEGEDSTSEVLV
ncbi:MAG: flagellar basal body-associated protein FliL, partial [Glaciecola sp.]